MANPLRPWRAVLMWSLAGVLLAGCAVVAVFRTPILAAAGWERTGAPTTVPATLFDLPTPTPSYAPGIGPITAAPTATDGAVPDRSVLEQRLAGVDLTALRAGVPAEGELVLAYQVLDVASGEVLAEANPDRLLIPASNAKLLTATALLSAFEATDTFDTKVVMPSDGQIVLVGGGDPMLVSEASQGVPKPASLAELAAATAEALTSRGISTVSLGYDATLFEEQWAPSWPQTYEDQVTRISALWVDEGRDANQVRSSDPAADAAATFSAQLASHGITVEGEPTAQSGSGEELASVSSPPIHALAEAALLPSNNSYTEVLGMQLALKLGLPATFEGSGAAIQQQLTSLGLWGEGAQLHDSSGLSRSNLVSATMLAGVARQLVIDPKLTIVQDGMPVAGVSGSLQERFGSEATTAGRGVARGKTGTLSQVASLAGVTVTADGREVAFAFVTNGSNDGWAAREWIDQSVALITSCGC